MLMSLPDVDERAYPNVVHGVYTRRISVTLQDRAGGTVADVSSLFQGGDITVDAAADVTRMANVSILDPWHLLGFDADTYQGGALDLTRQLRIVWNIRSPLLSREIRIGVFKGPVTALNRDGAMVELEGSGTEVLGLGRAPRVLQYPEGTKRTDVIKHILKNVMGVQRLGQIGNLPARLGDDLTIKPDDQPWKVAKKLAQSMSRELFFDGNGVPIMRVLPDHVAWTFRSGKGGGLTGNPRVNADLTNVKNHIRVIGKTPKNGGAPPVGAATAAANHPLSPENLGPPGAPMYLTEVLTNEHCKTKAECVKVAEDRLRFTLRLIHAVEFDSAPIAHLDPHDLIRLRTSYEDVQTHLTTFTLPLTLDGDMTVGYSDPYRLKRVRRRKHGKKHGGKKHPHRHGHGGKGD